MTLNLESIAVALLVAIGGAVAALTFAPEASAHTLSMRQARRQIKSLVVEKARFGYEPRSMIMYCGRRTAHFVHCDVLYADAIIRENLSAPRCHRCVKAQAARGS